MYWIYTKWCKLLAEWIVNGYYPSKESENDNDFDTGLLSESPNVIDIKRVDKYTKNINIQIFSGKETIGEHSPIPNPYYYRKSFENIRNSIVYGIQKYKQNGQFICEYKKGYQIPVYFGDIKMNDEINDVYSIQPWQKFVDNEIYHAKNECVLFDRTGYLDSHQELRKEIFSANSAILC